MEFKLAGCVVEEVNKDTEEIIRVNNLSKAYKVHYKSPGLKGSIKSFWKRDYSYSRALEEISFTVRRGEVVGLLGNNGAGKTTLLKILSGIMHSSSGEVEVLGGSPSDRKPEYLKRISMLMGHKSQLNWDLSASDSFLLHKVLYGVDDASYEKTISQLIDKFRVRDVVNKQVRKMSLGERMKCEVILSLIHKPEIIFLDEPTLGLDINSQIALRKSVKEYASESSATIILTSHYLEDIKFLCDRVIMIDEGKVLYDDQISGIVKKFGNKKTIFFELQVTDNVKSYVLENGGSLVNDYTVSFEVEQKKSPDMISEFMKRFPAIDVRIEEPSLSKILFGDR